MDPVFPIIVGDDNQWELSRVELTSVGGPRGDGVDGRHDGGGDAAVAAADRGQHAAAAEAADVEGEADEQREEEADHGPADEADYSRAHHCSSTFTRIPIVSNPKSNVRGETGK